MKPTQATFFLRLTPAVQLVEGVEAALEVGQQRELPTVLLSFALLDNRAQEVGDAGESADAVLRLQVLEDLRLEVSKTQIGEVHAARAARAEHDVTLRELGPLAQQPRRFENRGQTTFCAISLRKSKTWSVPGFH